MAYQPYNAAMPIVRETYTSQHTVVIAMHSTIRRLVDFSVSWAIQMHPIAPQNPTNIWMVLSTLAPANRTTAPLATTKNQAHDGI